MLPPVQWLLSVDQAGRGEDRHERLEAAVHVGNGDDLAGGGARERARGERCCDEDGSEERRTLLDVRLRPDALHQVVDDDLHRVAPPEHRANVAAIDPVAEAR